MPSNDHKPLPPDLDFLPYGGDYSPEQWTEREWLEDIRCFRAAGVNTATVGVFSWGAVETEPGRFDFAWLDRAIDLLWDNGIHLCLATGTAAHPAWLSQAHPEVLLTTVDGRRTRHGRRINFCPNSPAYRKAAAAYVRELAARYADHPALLAWHIGNEYGHGNRGSYCYCDQCARAFRTWLQQKYASLEKLNATWYTAFWGHRISDWEQIEPPSLLNDLNPAGPSVFPAKSLDYRRFQSDSHLACFRAEREILRAANPKIPATTNLMGSYEDLDYWSWAEHLDFISWDCYSPIEDDPALPAFGHDLMRSLKPETPFWLMECDPGFDLHRPTVRLRRPGGLQRFARQALARGANGILYFQLRQGRGGVEKFHSAVVQQGRRTDTRTFRACAELGSRLNPDLHRMLEGHPTTDTAILFDWNTRWAFGHCAIQPSRLDYLGEARRFHGALYDLGVLSNFVSVEHDLSRYRVLLLPLGYAFPESFAERLTRFVESGGQVVLGAFSGRADENDLLWNDSVPGPLRALLGIRVEEYEDLDDPSPVRVRGCSDGLANTAFPAQRLVEVVTPESADTEVLATFAGGIADGLPALTRRRTGKGAATYLATSPDRKDLAALLRRLLPTLPEAAPTGLERIPRGHDADGNRIELVLNHGKESIALDGLQPPASGLHLLAAGTPESPLPPAEMCLLRWC